MRHRIKKASLNRPADQRKALVRNLLTSLFLSGTVKTTDAKAKVLASEVDKLIVKVKGKSDMNAIRDLTQVLFTKESSQKALNYIKKNTRNSGFTQKVKMGYRSGDNALLIQIQLLDYEVEPQKN